jgi:hypothetical protein
MGDSNICSNCGCNISTRVLFCFECRKPVNSDNILSEKGGSSRSSLNEKIGGRLYAAFCDVEDTATCLICGYRGEFPRMKPRPLYTESGFSVSLGIGSFFLAMFVSRIYADLFVVMLLGGVIFSVIFYNLANRLRKIQCPACDQISGYFHRQVK